jgi:hypothetical protein
MPNICIVGVDVLRARKLVQIIGAIVSKKTNFAHETVISNIENSTCVLAQDPTMVVPYLRIYNTKGPRFHSENMKLIEILQPLGYDIEICVIDEFFKASDRIPLNEKTFQGASVGDYLIDNDGFPHKVLDRFPGDLNEPLEIVLVLTFPGHTKPISVCVQRDSSTSSEWYFCCDYQTPTHRFGEFQGESGKITGFIVKVV